MKCDNSPRVTVAAVVSAARTIGSGAIGGTSGTIAHGAGGVATADSGRTASGGANASGGASGTGGANAVGGTTGNGGRSNQGGIPAAGGTLVPAENPLRAAQWALAVLLALAARPEWEGARTVQLAWAEAPARVV